MSAELKPLFEPRSIFLVGNSELTGEDRIYSDLFHLLVQNLSGYKRGKVFLIDLSGKIPGSCNNLNMVKVGLDLAIVLLPEKSLAKNLHKLVSRQPKSLLLMVDELEEKMSEELVKMMKRKTTIIVGPDSIGIINTKTGLIAVPEKWQIFGGDVAVISQDSCIARNILRLATNFGISKLVNINENFGTDESDFLSYLSKDKETKCICIYLKKVRGGRRFIKTLADAVAEKPVIVLSGTIAGTEILEAAVKQAGGIIAHHVREMLNGGAAVAKQPPLLGERIAIITNVTGPAELSEKYLLEKGISLAKPSTETVEKLQKNHPAAKISNFINLGKAAGADAYKRAAELLLSDEKVDGIMMINSMKATRFEMDDLRKITDVAKKSKEKPVVDAALCADNSEGLREIVSKSTLPIYTQIEEAVEAIGILKSWGKQIRRPQGIKSTG
ncbi:MAG: hypothetical protein ACP5PX_01120 [Candidatus Hadarchaeum sp.]|uniref:hypothetical protein n=1 Tax=Candidatus Hadarchaeum sp. TaxID=2883567 RepID=UPI003D151DC9